MSFAIRIFRASQTNFFCVTPRGRNEGANLLAVIPYLHLAVIDDDRATEDARMLSDERDELGYLHRVEIDVLFLHQFRARRDDVVSAILAFDDHLFYLTWRKAAEDIAFLKGDILFFEPLFDLAAA